MAFEGLSGGERAAVQSAGADWVSGEMEQRRGAAASTGVRVPTHPWRLPALSWKSPGTLQGSAGLPAPTLELAFWGRVGPAAWLGAWAGAGGWPELAEAAVWARDASEPRCRDP